MKQFATSLLTTAACSSLALTAQAQSGTLTGTVQTATGEPLPGANVFIKGTFQSTATDRQGNFTLPVSRQTALPFVLSVQFVGFETHSDTIRSLGQPLRVVLAKGATLMNEVVVSASRVHLWSYRRRAQWPNRVYARLERARDYRRRLAGQALPHSAIGALSGDR